MMAELLSPQSIPVYLKNSQILQHTEFQIRGGIKDNSKIIFLISQ